MSNSDAGLKEIFDEPRSIAGPFGCRHSKMKSLRQQTFDLQDVSCSQDSLRMAYINGIKKCKESNIGKSKDTSQKVIELHSLRVPFGK